jgi:acid phosphatase family membrane protein YuiD
MELPDSRDAQRLRERVGHTPVEIAGGIGVGAVVAFTMRILESVSKVMRRERCGGRGA